LASRFAPVIMLLTCRKCGADAGQMRAAIGRHGAMEGADAAAERHVVGVIGQKLI